MAVKVIANSRDVNDGGTILGLRIDQFEEIGERELFRRIVEIAAEKYVSENYAEIVKHLDQRAIATLALAHASKMTAEASMVKDFAKATEHLETIAKDVVDRQRRL